VNGEVHRGQASCGSVTCASRFLIGPVAITWSRLDVLLSVAGTGRERNLMPGGMTAQTDDELWSAIADPSRRRQVLDLLVSNGEASASWLAGRVPFSRQAVSKHLVVLERAGLVSRRSRTGKCCTR
jgi:Helix-turn-helix domain